jgi:putative ATPase
MGGQAQLFDRSAPPLADRLRPRSLSEVVGQQALIGDEGVLRALLARGELPSMVLWGPPGCGKTTIARLLAAAAEAELVSFSAVLSGVKEARQVMAEAAQRLRTTGQRTVLFVDEIHRFNRAQQDAFLPFVESGDIILVGATTENPSFELNRALLSRVKVYILEPLSEDEVQLVLERALDDRERGLKAAGMVVESAALEAIVRLAAGDARQALNHLELAVQVGSSEGAEAVDEALVQRVAQRALALYDKGREEHFNLISALHKAVRNSDVDAALYWLGRMLEGGADPRYVVRRMLRMASEDIGMADPRALEQVVAAAATVEHVGMPECELALAQSAVYLALAPKSNALYTAYGAVKKEVARRPGLAIPMWIRNAPTRLMRDAGYGRGYRYAHDEAGAVADMDCLPEELVNARFYRPTEYGWEARIRQRLAEIAAARKKR